MKLSEYAKRHSISYRTAHRHWKQGFIKGTQIASGTIVVEEESSSVVATKQRAVLYARVSTVYAARNARLKPSLRNFTRTNETC